MSGVAWHRCDNYEALNPPVGKGEKRFPGYGPALDATIYLGEDGRWVAGNDEYGVRIAFCPFCGAKLIENLHIQVDPTLTWPAIKNGKCAKYGAIKQCACGESYTKAEWKELRFVGEQKLDDGKLELRDCVCGSTIAIRKAEKPGR